MTVQAPDYTLVPTQQVLATQNIPAAVAYPGGVLSPRTDPIKLFTGATVAASSPVVDRVSYRGPAAIVLANVGTGSPAMSVDIKGSVDGVNFYNIAYALVATPNTVAVAQIAITTSATTTYLLPTDQAWRYLRLDVSAVTTETWTATYYQ
jgi:hypothetical protein